MEKSLPYSDQGFLEAFCELFYIYFPLAESVNIQWMHEACCTCGQPLRFYLLLCNRENCVISLANPGIDDKSCSCINYWYQYISSLTRSSFTLNSCAASNLTSCFTLCHSSEELSHPRSITFSIKCLYSSLLYSYLNTLSIALPTSGYFSPSASMTDAS